MTFAIEHIAIAFGLGFLFGSLFGIGFSLRKKASQSARSETLIKEEPPMHSTPSLNRIRPREAAIQTLDIPTIRPDSELAEENLDLPMNLPEPEPLHTSEVRMFAQDGGEPEEDATVLMQKPPPK